jgi:uncharacterized RDD family membrane protein YckC
MPEPQRASVLRRLTSMLYESLLLAAVLAVGFLFPEVLLGMLTGRAALPGVALAHFVAVAGLYFVWFWLHGGQTLAMKTWKLRLVDAASGGPLRPLQAVLRFLAAWPSVCLGIGILWVFLDPDRQFLHDRIAGSRLISELPPQR